MSIGVYGHPSHETTRFSLLVYQETLNKEEHYDEQNPFQGLDDGHSSQVAFKNIFNENPHNNPVDRIFLSINKSVFVFFLVQNVKKSVILTFLWSLLIQLFEVLL